MSKKEREQIFVGLARHRRGRFENLSSEEMIGREAELIIFCRTTGATHVQKTIVWVHPEQSFSKAGWNYAWHHSQFILAVHGINCPRSEGANHKLLITLQDLKTREIAERKIVHFNKKDSKKQ